MTQHAGQDAPFVDPGPPGDWAKRASCSGMVIALLDFFGKRRVDWSTSKQVCAGCPVRRECLTYALDARMVNGVWGMLDPLELRLALGRNAEGAAWTYTSSRATRVQVRCPYCRGGTTAARLTEEDVRRTCQKCGFSWVRAERERARRRRRR